MEVGNRFVLSVQIKSISDVGAVAKPAKRIDGKIGAGDKRARRSLVLKDKLRSTSFSGGNLRVEGTAMLNPTF
jgi:hypothetical protein